MSKRTIEWPGASGKRYKYWILPINAVLKDAPGNYIYAKETESRKWSPLYIGQTTSLRQRLTSHEKEASAIRRGATAQRTLTVTVMEPPSQPIVNTLVAANMTVCRADRLRLSAFPDTVASNSVRIVVTDPLGTTNRYLTTTSAPIEFQFDRAGAYSVLGMYGAEGVAMSNAMTVTALDPCPPVANVFDGGGMAVRAGDVLPLTAHPAGNTNGYYIIAIDGPSPEPGISCTNEADAAVDIPFPQPGTYTLGATYTSHLDASQATGTMTVTVRAGSLVTPSCQVGHARTIEIAGVPDGVALDGGAAIGIEVFTGTNNVKQAMLTAAKDGPRHVVARLGCDGPILASAPVNAFSMFIDSSRYHWDADKRHVECAMTADYLPSTIVLNQEMTSENAYLDVNRSLWKTITANASSFDPSGLYRFMVVPDTDDKGIDTSISVSEPQSPSAPPLMLRTTDNSDSSALINTIQYAPVSMPSPSSGSEPCTPIPRIYGKTTVIINTDETYTLQDLQR